MCRGCLTNSLRDIIWGDLVSGTSRGVDALIAAVGIATGVGTFLRLWDMIEALDDISNSIMVLATTGFGILFNILKDI